MNRWTAASAVLALVFVTTASVAQTPEELQRQLKEVMAIQKQQAAELEKLKTENAELKSQNVDDSLEVEVNRLSERLAAGTTLKSDANQIKMGGEFRFRSTWSFGDNSSSFSYSPPSTVIGGKEFGEEEHDGSYNDARVRINFTYDFTKDVTAFVELQEHWAFGTDDDGPINNFDSPSDGNDVNLYQGWLEVRNVFCRPELTSKVGRQEIVLGNQFQFGNADWFNGVVFDGGRWDWNSDSFSLTALALKLSSQDGDINQYYSFQTPHDDDELYGLYFTLKTIKNHKLDIYWMYVNGHAGASGGGSLNSGAYAGFGNNLDIGGSGITGFLYPSITAYFHTIGGRIGGWFDVAAGLDWNLEAAYQFGDAHGFFGADADVDAFTVEAELGITFGKESRFRIYARGLYAEGPDDDDVGYLTLFPNRHSHTASFRARYGIADLIPMSNVWTGQLGFHFDPFQNWTFGATGLWAGADEEGSNGAISGSGGSDDDDYGFEIDVWGEYRYSDQLTFGGGVAFVWPDDQGEFLWGTDDDTQFIGYLQARLLF
jgi:serine protease inhibitor ecotin